MCKDGEKIRFPYSLNKRCKCDRLTSDDFADDYISEENSSDDSPDSSSVDSNEAMFDSDDFDTQNPDY